MQLVNVTFLIFSGVFVVDIDRKGLIAGAGGAVGTVVVVVGLVVGLNVAFDEVRKGFLEVVATVGNTILLLLSKML